MPLHDPLRLAQDITLIDLVSSGRFSATCGLGYRESEYLLYGVDWKNRGEIFDQKLEILLRALRGERFIFHGQDTHLVPTPRTAARALLMVGGNSKAAARRAARFGLYFCPAIDDPALEAAYQAECLVQGFSHGFTIFPREPATTFISDDPDACWNAIGAHLLYDATAYSAWRHPTRRAYAESLASDIKGLRSEGKYRILTPDQALQVLAETSSLHLAPLAGGVPLEVAWRSLRLFEDRVQPFL